MKFSVTNYPIFGLVVLVCFAGVPWLFNMAGLPSPLSNSMSNFFPGLMIFIISGLGATYIVGGIVFLFLNYFSTKKE